MEPWLSRLLCCLQKLYFVLRMLFIFLSGRLSSTSTVQSKYPTYMSHTSILAHIRHESLDAVPSPESWALKARPARGTTWPGSTKQGRHLKIEK